METIFNGITINVEAANPKEAYAKLCEILEVGVKSGGFEYSTDTYTTDDVDTSDPDNDRSTADLFPNSNDEAPSEPKTLTRDQAIEELADWRLEDHDSSDRRAWLIDGRIGYAKMSNAELAELYAEAFELTQAIITGQEPEPTVEVKKAEHDKQADTIKQMLDGLKLLQAVKGLIIFECGWATLEDGTQICLNDLIAQAEGTEERHVPMP